MQQLRQNAGERDVEGATQVADLVDVAGVPVAEVLPQGRHPLLQRGPAVTGQLQRGLLKTCVLKLCVNKWI